jgi:acetylornithine deacetylase/succinyl-diaminopimelate desuccinylase-like protein
MDAGTLPDSGWRGTRRWGQIEDDLSCHLGESTDGPRDFPHPRPARNGGLGRQARLTTRATLPGYALTPVRYRGRPATSLKPILLLAHLDVVEARKEDWSPDLDPFRFIEKDGYFYGRGTADEKAMAAIFVANLIRMKQQGLVPARAAPLTVRQAGETRVTKTGRESRRR